ncbi:MFS transporter [Demequina sp. SYSU T00039]|uniref:MFS transporter n=1 Tax=Demequina lignilytica TaxID=3051663 RepID=A0AAW7M9A1_9MICO|nr:MULTISPECIES: MFS transporter [unclassified Demequina]MDN4477508.1 MFS transporter [Demequina sp. SYSU T00039-1]MDN4488141.1 MFS transporter [Demequina sp. SYSU T00039]MDN4490582.1 MFS transporter [Demequina sp. SYSU T00068]
MPTFLAEIGIGAILPVLALSVADMGHTAAFASLAVAAYQLGRLPGSALGGAIAHRWGSTHAAMAALAVIAAGSVLAAWAPHLAVFMVGAVIVGLGHAWYHVARQGQILAIITPDLTARSLTTLAGVWRIANFIGPLLGAALIGIWGLAATYWMGAAFLVAAIAALGLSPAARERPARADGPRISLRLVARENLPVLRTLGVTVIATGALRQARIAVIPLWATHVGLSPQAATLIYSISAAIDMLLFYPAGAVMDRWGRRWTAIPSTLLLALGTLALPLTAGATQVTIAALLLGLGNGWGSGLVMTLGADVAPAEGRTVFTGLWMVLQDVGGLLGPALVSVGALIALPVGFVAVGGMGLATVGGFVAWIPSMRSPGHVAE